MLDKENTARDLSQIDNKTLIETATRKLLLGIGENPDREGLLTTPERVAKSYEFLTKGYQEDPSEIIKKAIFEEDVDEMVVVKDIEFYSMCEHHLLPFFGSAHIAYIPKGKIVGLSKVARLIEIYARRLQVQERMTKQIAETLKECLNPLGVAVVIKAEHMCMQMRGVEKRESVMVTSSMMGAFKKNPATRSEFMDFIKSSL